MNTLTTYILESIACTGMAYLVYEIFIKNMKLFVFNRAYLLLSFVLSLLAPTLYIKSPEVIRHAILQSPITETITATSSLQEQFTGELIQLSPFEQFSMFNLIVLVYLGVAAFLLIQFFVSLARIYFLLDKNGPRFDNMLIVYSQDVNPHSFFNFLFIQRPKKDNAIDEGILLHESAHGRQYHTLDILFIHLAACVFWFNPFIWLMKKAIAENHEFLADNFAIERLPEKKDYAESLLQMEDTRIPFQLTSHFSYRLTKNRIQMMFRQAPHPFKRTLSLALSLTLVISLITISACRVQEVEKTTLVVVDAGHGGKDHGVQLENTSEKEINMAIAQKLKELSEFSSVEVLLTRSNDDYMSIEERSAAANALNADLFLSIHASQAESTKNGIEIYVANEGPKHQQSEILGKLIYSKLDAFEEAPISLKGADFKILKGVDCPTVLVGVGFMSNAQDLEKLTNEDYQHQLAYELLRAIEGY